MARSKQKDDELLKVTLEMERGTYNRFKKLLKKKNQDPADFFEELFKYYERRMELEEQTKKIVQMDLPSKIIID